MKTTISMKALLLLSLCIAVSTAAGFLNGLTGTGAGILFLLLSRILGGSISKDSFAFSMSCVIPLSAFSLLTYPFPNSFSLPLAATTVITAVLGGMGGALLQQKLKITTLKRIFAILVIYSGIRMIFKV